MENFTISIDSYIAEFEQILNSTDRLIFSGRFGDGKSYFLNEFKHKTEDENFKEKKGDSNKGITFSVSSGFTLNY